MQSVCVEDEGSTSLARHLCDTVRVRVRVGLGLGFRVGLGLGLAFLYLGDTVARAHEAILYAADFDVRHLRPIQRAVAG